MKNTLLGIVLVANFAAFGQGVPPARLDSSLVRFFVGKWAGKGAFANGRPIAAKVEFRLGLDSAWLVCEHRDELPNRYKADLYWGVDAGTTKFVAYAFDNFHGHRVFASDGWVDGKLVLTREAEAPNVGKYFERFLYERVDANSFRMTYETSRDGSAWRMGDSLVFTRG